MRVQSLFVVSALVTLIAHAAPVAEVEARAPLGLPKLAPKPPVIPPPPPQPAPKPSVDPTNPSTPSVSAPPPADIPTSSATTNTVVPPVTVSSNPPPTTNSLDSSSRAATTTSPLATIATSSLATIATSSLATTTASSLATTTSASSTSSAPSAANTTVADSADNSTDVSSCPLYTEADAVDLAARQLALENRGNAPKEEFWFRFDDPALANSGDILQLAAHDKIFDDQAYKWISTDARKVTRSRTPGRAGVLYVLPPGTRASILKAAQKFEETSVAQQAADFVVKENERNDVGINGVAKSADGTIPLDVFRSKVIRAVVKKVSAKAKGKATFVTIQQGQRRQGAEKVDQDALAFVCG